MTQYGSCGALVPGLPGLTMDVVCGAKASDYDAELGHWLCPRHIPAEQIVARVAGSYRDPAGRARRRQKRKHAHRRGGR